MPLDSTPQSATQTANATQSVTISTSGYNDIIFAAVMIAGTGNSISSISAGGLTFNRRLQNNATGPSFDLWSAVTSSPVSAQSVSITINTAAQNWDMIVFAFSGTDPVSPLDPNANSAATVTGTGGTPTITGISTTNANVEIIAIVAINVTFVQTAGNIGGSGSTFGLNVTQTGIAGAFEYELFSSAQSSISAAFGTAVGGTNKWIVAVVSIVQLTSSFAVQGKMTFQNNPFTFTNG